MNNPYEQQIAGGSMQVSSEQASTLVRIYLNKIYLWMGVALLVTALVAGYTSTSQEAMNWISSGLNRFIVIAGSIACFLVMIFAYRKLSASAVGVLFLTYSALTGLLFGPESLALAFGVTAGTFGAMSLFGALTKINLSKMGRICTMMLIGLIIAIIANIFVGSSMLQLGICIVGVVIFSLLTASDTQKLVEEGRVLEPNAMGKPAIMGALTLYLDFINLFIFLLQLLGNREE